MFSSNTAIWKYANSIDEFDDVFTEAEELILKWSRHIDSEVEFKSIGEIYFAALLLEDGLLPVPAKKAFAKVMRKAINEAYQNKLCIKSLYIHPPKPGRKNNQTASVNRCREVMRLINNGESATDAYKVVAEKHFKSPDTIRRDYERIVLKERKRKKAGENDK